MKAYLIILLSLLLMVSCGKKKESRTIIVPKMEAEKVTGPLEMQAINNAENEVEWLGTTYKVVVNRQVDKDLPMVEYENGKKAYDNRIRLEVKRKDGSVFFTREFTKKDFERYVDDITKKRGVLLGIVLDRADEDNLIFGASVGSPDVLSDEYVPMELILNRMGSVTIKKSTQLDAIQEQPEDEGV